MHRSPTVGIQAYTKCIVAYTVYGKNKTIIMMAVVWRCLTHLPIEISRMIICMKRVLQIGREKSVIGP